MRLRRETGDFSIRFDGDTHTCEIRKGLNAEDLIGVVIQFGTLVSVVTAVIANEGNYEFGVAGVPSSDSVTYNPVTGVVTYTRMT